MNPIRPRANNMDFEVVLKRIEKLESQYKSLTKALSTHNNQINGLEGHLSQKSEQIREFRNDLSKLTTTMNSLGSFDSTLTKLRVDIKRQIDDSENRNKLNLKMQEKLRNDELQAVEEKITKAIIDGEKKWDQKLNLFLDEDKRIVQQFKEIRESVDNYLNSGDEIRGSLNFVQQELIQNKKVVESLSHQVDVVSKKMDSLKERQDTIQNDLKTSESRIIEIVATENDRKQTFINFMEQQTLSKNERDRTWLEWQEQFEASKNQMNIMIPDLQKKQIELGKLSKSFNEMTEKIERRINEVAEMYRLMDEKFRQEWVTYRSDLEKRWTNISLVMDEKQSELSESNKAFRERVTKVEDDTHEMKEGLLLMSREIQNGMQGIMNMVNGWMDAFGQIDSEK